MVVTIFRNRHKPGIYDTYLKVAKQMGELAVTMPGYISHKTFTADDGERVTIVEFENEEGQKVWSTNARHVAAKAQGRADFYTEYRLQVCQVLRDHAFPKK